MSGTSVARGPMLGYGIDFVGDGVRSRRVVEVGLALTALAVAVQTAADLVNHFAGIDSFWLDAAGEGNEFAWLSSAAIFGSGLLTLLLALAETGPTVLLSLLAAAMWWLSLDDAIEIHERTSRHVHLGLPEVLEDRVDFVTFAPLLGFVLIGLLLVAARIPAEFGRWVRLGTVLLVAAVIVDEVIDPASEALDDALGIAAIDAVRNSLEEALEVAGWTLILLGLAATLMRLIETGAPRNEHVGEE